MGLNTAVLVLNDYISFIADRPDFGKELHNAMAETSGRPRDRHYYSGFDVLPAVHADYDQFIVIGQNRIRRFEDIEPEEAKKLMKHLAWRMGLKISFRKLYV